MTLLYIFIGGGIGSIARFGVGKFIHQVWETNFPIGTLMANVLACIILGLFAYLIPVKSSNEWLQPMLLVGFCGGFSTFSTFSNESVVLLSNGNYWLALLNVLLSVLIGFGVLLLMKEKLA